MEDDLSSFVNPDGYWEHQGAFSVELTQRAGRAHVPATVRFEGNIAYVDTGRIKQTVGGIQLYSFEKPFFWPYDRMRVIRNKDGKLLWVNKDYSTMG